VFPTTAQITGSSYIRRRVDCNGQTLYSNSAQIIVTPLNAGSISGGGNVPFNTIPSVTQTPASRSVCSPVDYVYTWERSVNNGPWLSFASGAAYPANVGIIGNCKIRRKVHCVYEDAYSNEITFTTTYTSPNKENLNYVRTNDIVIPNVHSWEQADALPTGDKLQSTTYLDGFGRAIQTVVKQASLIPTANPNDIYVNNNTNYQDLVSHIDYDGLGRTDKAYLPYATATNLGFFKTNAASEQQSFTNQKYGEPAGSIYTYAQSFYDGSPLNRVLNVKAPGAVLNNDANYQGISSDYDFNKLSENVRVWNIGFNSGDRPVIDNTVYAGGIYPDNKFVKSIAKDEKGKLVITYTDLSGNTILKRVQLADNAANPPTGDGNGWVSTYYVFDDFNRLRYTITPKAVELMANTNNWTIDDDTKTGLCFYQEYDSRGRVIVKHSPDGGEIWLVYDNRDRLVLSQDENQRNRNTIPSKSIQWSYSLYDENDRALVTGLIDDTRNRVEMQAFVNDIRNSSYAGNQPVDIYTGNWETITAYNPVAGKISSGGFYCKTCTQSYVNTVSYYDDYSKRPLSQKPINLTAADFPNTSSTYVEAPTVSYVRIRGALTVSKVRVLDDKYDNGNLSDEKFLTSTSYYDEKGRVIQTHADNYKNAVNGVDVLAVLYDFAGKVLSTRGKHGMPGNDFDNLLVFTKSKYDLLGSPFELLKLYTKNSTDVGNDGKYKKLSNTWLDEFGRVKTHIIGDGSPNNGEDQHFTYDIQGRLTGMNKDYALAYGGTMSNQWSRHFGYYLDYENVSGSFAQKQYNGSITGAIWRSQGDNAQRKFDYEYDNLGRFRKANFTQKVTPDPNVGYSNSLIDFTTTVSGYDANGNIQGMKHMGIVPGTNGGIVLDDLLYNYDIYNNGKTNKLGRVDDAANTIYSGKQGDFKDYAATRDYNYDFNGNLTYDKNKNILDAASNQANNDPNAGIISNFLDLPQTITVKDKSKTEYIYDAGGGKLGKKVTNLAVTPNTVTTTWFIAGFVYEETGNTTSLQYILNEEGKLRIVDEYSGVAPGSAGALFLTLTGNVDFGITNKRGVWDYYLKDNLSNTRMVLTEEQHQQQMVCTMEAASATTTLQLQLEEEREFSSPSGNEVATTRIDKNLTNWAANPSNYVSKLVNTPGKAVGPNAILKVMAGDIINANAKYFYEQAGAAQNTSILTNVVNTLLGGLGASTVTGGGIKDNISTTIPGLAGSNIFSFIQNQQTATGASNTPRAYLNILFFDEQFRYVNDDGSIAEQIKPIISGNSITDILNTPDIRVPKNGYVYIYLSNETQNIPVYFDDLIITHNRGGIIEDNAYYPFGLKIQGISSRAAGKIKTKEGYQGDYNQLDEESGYNEFALRFYDAQIGRWIQVDPYEEFASGYTGMGNNPVSLIDPNGGSVDPPAKTLEEVVVKCLPKKVAPSRMEVVPKVISVGRVVTNAFNIYNSTDGNSSFMLSTNNPTIEPSLFKMDGKTLYVHSGQYFTTSIEFHDEANPNYIDPEAKKASDEFFDKFEFKLVSGRPNSVFGATYKNGLGQIISEPARNQALGDDLVGQTGAFIATGGGKIITSVGKGVYNFTIRGATKTSTSLVQANRTAGNLFRDELAAALRAEGRIVNTEVFKRTPFGPRYMDLDVWHKGVNLGGIETKVGGSRYLSLQKLKDAWLGANGYPVNLVRKTGTW
jgi:RHS repeat-associated protein